MPPVSAPPEAEQALLDLRLRVARRGPRPARPAGPVASELPVARVAVAVALPHLDRPFDYEVPAELSAAALPGARVRVRFAGKRVDGFVLDRLTGSDSGKALAPLAAVVSPEQVLTPAVARLAREVADRWAGTLADVLRLAVPPRHARVEGEPARPPGPPPPHPDHGTWGRYAEGPGLVEALGTGAAPRALWVAPPGPAWPAELAVLVAATLAGGRGALVVVPDARELVRVDRALAELLGPDRHVALSAELGPAERYRRWLRVLRGEVQAVVGTRAAAFAPVHRLGLAVCWDDGDELHAEPRAPYPHARDVLVLRAHLEQAGLVIGGVSPSVDAVALAEAGWLSSLQPDRETLKALAPRIRAAADDGALARDPAARGARIPLPALAAVRAALADGAVLVQVPRRGYQPGLACGRCRTPARCVRCAGPLGRSADRGPLACRWCGTPAPNWGCEVCHGHELRATVTGARRTAEELGRAFPGVPVVASGRDEVVLDVPDRPALVIATPGAEPVCAGAGYAAALLLDGWALLGRAELRAAEEALRRWLGAVALVRPQGPVFVGADAGIPAVQALLRLDPRGFAVRELGERAQLGFPPAVRMAAVDGEPAAVAAMVAAATAALGGVAGADVLGPVPWRLRDGEDGERALLRVPARAGRQLAAALSVAQRSRSATRSAGAVRVELDPVRLA